MVEVEGWRTLLPACATVATPGMVIQTESARVDAARKIVGLLLGSGNHNCLVCEANGECELQALAYRYQVPTPAFANPPGTTILLRRQQQHDRPGFFQVHHVRPLRPGLQRAAGQPGHQHRLPGTPQPDRGQERLSLYRLGLRLLRRLRAVLPGGRPAG